MDKALEKRWESKRDSIYNLKSNIDRVKRCIKKDLVSCSEKDRLTALIIRIMLYTSERVGNRESATNGHFGVTQFKKKHIKVVGKRVILDYIGKSGVQHEKSFVDVKCASMIKSLLSRNNEYVFTTKNGFTINPDRVNRYLSKFDAKSKDIRGFNANRLVIMELNRIGKTEEKLRPRIFNDTLRKVGAKVGHKPITLRTHYLLPEIEESFYKRGSVKNISIC